MSLFSQSILEFSLDLNFQRMKDKANRLYPMAEQLMSMGYDDGGQLLARCGNVKRRFEDLMHQAELRRQLLLAAVAFFRAAQSVSSKVVHFEVNPNFFLSFTGHYNFGRFGNRNKIPQFDTPRRRIGPSARRLGIARPRDRATGPRPGSFAAHEGRQRRAWRPGRRAYADGAGKARGGLGRVVHSTQDRSIS